MKYILMAGIAFVLLTMSNSEKYSDNQNNLSYKHFDYQSDFSSRKRYKVKKYNHKKYIRGQANNIGSYYGHGSVIGGRPSGCPRAYCGCASAKFVGLSGSRWNLAANWLKLPRAHPAPMMAAARRGHVFILLSHSSGSNWLVYDPNSGGGLTRRHIRSIAGYTIVNPRIRYADLKY